MRKSQAQFFSLSNEVLWILLIWTRRTRRRFEFNRSEGVKMDSLALHHIQCMTIQNSHQPGAKWLAGLETWQASPGQQKSSLSNIFSQARLVTEAHRRSHCYAMMFVPQQT